MRLAAALISVACLLAIARPARAQEPNDLDVAFQEAVDALLASEGKAAAAAFGDLVEKRWEELSPRGRHGASTLLMFALLLDGREEEACARGAKLHAAMPEVFCPLGKEGGPEVARAVRVLSVRVGKGKSLLYVHNASDQELAIEDTRYEVVYGFKTSSTSVGEMKSDGSPAFPRALVLPPGKGVVVQSAEGGGGLLGMAAVDVVCVLGAHANSLRPDWIYLTIEDYSQTLTRLRVVAGKVRWGEQTLEGVALVDLTAEAAPPAGEGESPPADGEKTPPAGGEGR